MGFCNELYGGGGHFILLYRFDDMMFQAVRNERRRGQVVGSLDSDPEDPKFKSEPETAKKNSKHMNTSPCSSAAERLQHRQSPNLTVKVRKTDDYRLISGRSQDRNLSGA